MAITLRPGRLDDSPAVFRVFRDAVIELGTRLGVTTITGGDDPAVLADLWETRRSLFDHLARTGAHYWIAESGSEAIGYARSTLRDGVLELTELFVLPGTQSAGVGRELLARAFPRAGERYRLVISTPDVRALTSYLKAGCYARFPIHHFARPARPDPPASDLETEPIDDSPRALELLAQIDQSVLGFRRDPDHAWLMSARHGVFYRREGRLVGYGYTGPRRGPFADPDRGPFAAFGDVDLPAMLASAERSAQPGTAFGVDVPLVNRAVVDYVLAQGFRMDPFATYLMSDAPFGRFDAYVSTSPSFFV
jgi:GNAT superfamily N-acetyltransferase